MWWLLEGWKEREGSREGREKREEGEGEGRERREGKEEGRRRRGRKNWLLVLHGYTENSSGWRNLSACTNRSRTMWQSQVSLEATVLHTECIVHTC